MRPIVAALSAVSLLVAASCAGGEITPSTGSELFFPTKPQQDVISMQALYRGPLVVRDACVLIGRSGNYTLPIWPMGFTAERGGSGQLEVRDGEDDVVAVEGETFEMAGGYIAEFRPQGKVDMRDDQVRSVEDGLGYPIPERCLGPDVYGIWSVGET